MATEVIMPRVDMDMTEGKIAFWYVKNGDAVTKGQVIFEIETDKATMEVDAPVAGTIDGIQGAIGESVLVGTTLGWILAAGETLAAQNADTAQAPAQADPNGELLIAETLPVAASNTPDDVAAVDKSSLRATPLARSLAHSHGVDLSSIVGTGPNGRVQGADVVQAASPAPAPLQGEDSDALYLNWIAEAEGIPLVLLHGFGADQGGWRNLAALIKGVPIIGIDLPNHGKSKARAIRSLDDLAAAVVARLDQEGVHAFHLLGHSMGGATALAMVAKVADRLKSLTLLAPAGLGADIHGGFIEGLCRANSEASLKPWLAELFHDESLLSNSFVATAFKQLESPQKREGLRALAQALMPDGTQASSKRSELNGLNIPTKVIWGADDKIIPVKHAQGLPGRVALHVLKNVGHLSYIEASELVASLITEQMR
jgi:pyruvate dehydrogenase E2 component (dihydrolipoamide acetyltransferase)